nr:cell wall protein AWA1-like isoform X2 [Rhipicephalus microplus]
MDPYLSVLLQTIPDMTITKEEALRILELDGTSPSAEDIQMHYQKLALKFHPTKRGTNLQSILRFESLCRSYLILTEGRESMTELLSQDEMLDVFVKAFELEGLRKELAAEDASTQWDEKPRSSESVRLRKSSRKSTASTASVETTTSNGATTSVGTSMGGDCARARAATPMGATASTDATTSTGATASTRSTASAGTTACNGTTSAAATSSTKEKPVIPEKAKQNVEAIAPISIEEKLQEKKKKKNASKKSRKQTTVTSLPRRGCQTSCWWKLSETMVTAHDRRLPRDALSSFAGGPLGAFLEELVREGILYISEELTAEDASTEWDEKPSTSKGISIQTSSSKSTASTASVETTTSNGATTSVGTSIWGDCAACARAATFMGATTSTDATTSMGATASTRSASAGTTACNGTTSAAATSSTKEKPVIPEKAKQDVKAIAPVSIEEKSQEKKKKKKKASKKSRKRRQQQEKQQLSKAYKSESSSSSEDEEKETEEDEDELDPNSAFVAMALRRKTNGAVPKPSVTSLGAIPKTPKMSTVHLIIRSQRLAWEGYELCIQERHKEAVELFTQAIKLYAEDDSYFGNRSYCYSILEKYDKALMDAEKAISLQPQVATGYFRRAKAQLGLQKYSEAAESFKKVLEIDPTCLEAQTELRNVHIFEIMSMGFSQEQAEWALTLGDEDFQRAIVILCGPDAVVPDVKMNPCNMDGYRSLWVGNIQPEVTEKMLIDLFRRYGDVHSIRILRDRYCAFINYGNKLSPGRAMEALQGHVLCGTAITIRFPDNNYLENGSKKGPVTVLRKSSLMTSTVENKAASTSSGPKAKLSGP